MNNAYEATWNDLYREIGQILSRFGIEDATSEDYWIVDRPYGYDQHNVNISDLKMLEPEIIYSLQRTLKKYTGWEIFVTVCIRQPAGVRWPDMGLIIREHEIIDGLKREYFPPEFRSIQYEGSRVGTDRD